MNVAPAIRRSTAKKRGVHRSPFWLIGALVMLALTFVGFSAFYTAGRGIGGREIAASIFPLVLVHGVALTAWMALLVSQSGLVVARSLKLHMAIGRWTMPVAAVCALSGVAVAVRSVELAPNFMFWGMPYWKFLLPMLVEMAVFSVFVITGYTNRRRPYRHRAMMILSGLAILAGATARIRALQPVFGDSGWTGLFGPILLLGLIGVVIQMLVSRKPDWWLAGGLAFMAVSYIGADLLADTSAWRWIARDLLGITIS